MADLFMTEYWDTVVKLGADSTVVKQPVQGWDRYYMTCEEMRHLALRSLLYESRPKNFVEDWEGLESSEGVKRVKK